MKPKFLLKIAFLGLWVELAVDNSQFPELDIQGTQTQLEKDALRPSGPMGKGSEHTSSDGVWHNASEP